MLPWFLLRGVHFPRGNSPRPVRVAPRRLHWKEDYEFVPDGGEVSEVDLVLGSDLVYAEEGMRALPRCGPRCWPPRPRACSQSPTSAAGVRATCGLRRPLRESARHGWGRDHFPQAVGAP